MKSLKKFFAATVALAIGVSAFAGAASAAEPVTSFGTVTASVLNIRADASTNGQVLGQVSKGQSVAIHWGIPGWVWVTSNGVTGYVSSDYVTIGGSGSPQTAVVEVSSDSLNLRASASTGAAVLTQIPNGAKLSVTDVNSGWAKVTYNGTSGYVSADYIRMGSSGSSSATKTASTSSSAASTRKAVVKLSSATLNLRASASTDASVLAQIPNGQSINVIETTNSGWAKVEYNGTTGYVSATYLDFGQSQTKLASRSGSVSSKGQAVVELAKQHLGKAYVYGATGPSNFDCSGLVYYVYKQMGVTLNRVADDQMSNGTPVSKDNLQPGDIVGFTNGSGYVNHVGIYAGNGMMIHAPQTGDVVKYESIVTGNYARRLIGGRRIF